MTALITVFILASCLSVLSQWTGFCRTTLILPLLISAAGVDNAVPMLILAQLVVAVSLLLFQLDSINHVRFPVVIWWTVPFGIIGAMIFIMLSAEAVTRGIGASFILFVFTKRFNMRGIKNRPYTNNAFIGFLSGVTGSQGPFAAVDAPNASAGASTLAANVSLAALIMYAAQMMIYQRFLEFDWQFWRMALSVSAAVLFASRCVAGQPRQKRHMELQRLVETTLIIIAAYMIVHGYVL